MSGSAARLEARGIELSYGHRRVLTGLGLALGPGDRACLVGPNGAGKSSLLRCLAGTQPVDRGEVLLDGLPLRGMGRSERARHIAVVPGQVELPFSARVEEVVGLGRIPYLDPLGRLREPDERRVAWAMERVGIVHLRGRDARELSLGERQLVLLAMALAQGGRVLLLDEPTVHLDLRHQVEVLSLLVDLSEDEGLTILGVLHDLALAARFFPRLLMLADGRLVADGPPARVLTVDRVGEAFGVRADVLAPLGAWSPAAAGTEGGSGPGSTSGYARLWGGS